MASQEISGSGSRLIYSGVFMRSNSLILLLLIFWHSSLVAQTPEQAVAQCKITRIWGGVAANGDQANFDFRAGFFPNDYDLVQHRGQGSENYLGSGYRLACTDWRSPDDSLYTAAVFGPKNDYMLQGKVVEELTSFTRYKYTDHTVNGIATGVTGFAVYDPSRFDGGTYDQIIEGTYKNVLGVNVKRRILGWSQSFNDNYIIIEVELTNVGVDKKAPDGSDILVKDTLKNFYFSMNQGISNNFYSNGSNPSAPSGERPNFSYAWQHYYGARESDSLRVFYFYSADDPSTPGDNMGAPVLTHNGRMLNTNFNFYTILHASKEPFMNSSGDVDDSLQPKVTYIGTETAIPNPASGEDVYGSKNYWAIRGGYSDKYAAQNIIPGTHHGLNNDELGITDFSNFPAGTKQSANPKNFSSFGPYNFPPDHKLRIVYAVGVAGIGIKTAAEIGRKWLNGTLDDPQNMPDPNTGWLPKNFQFPAGASENDRRKDRWISMGVDSVMLAAYRAKWNFLHNYQIPKAPPPPDYFHIRGSGQSGVLLIWSNPEAEMMPGFEGYSIKRRLSVQDTVFYVEIYNSGAEDKSIEHIVPDTTAIVGAPYYYYIQAKVRISENDMNADPSTRGKLLYSSRLWIPNLNSINPPPRNYVEGDISAIRIVPNPYNINDPLVKALYSDVDGRRLNFYNLPKTVTIRIYTENGDLIKLIEHNEPYDNTGLKEWNMITDSQQVISSGLYIAVFQTPAGAVSYQKFIVVR